MVVYPQIGGETVENQTENSTGAAAPATTTQVLRAVVESLDPTIPAPEKIVIHQATPTQYVGRIYLAGEDEYEPISATLPDQVGE
jgi:hypothetical protein